MFGTPYSNIKFNTKFFKCLLEVVALEAISIINKMFFLHQVVRRNSAVFSMLAKMDGFLSPEEFCDKTLRVPIPMYACLLQ